MQANKLQEENIYKREFTTADEFQKDINGHMMRFRGWANKIVSYDNRKNIAAIIIIIIVIIVVPECVLFDGTVHCLSRVHCIPKERIYVVHYHKFPYGA